MNIFLIIVPIFAVIALGFVARKTNLVPRGTATSLSNYVYYFALPAYIILEIGTRPFKDFWETSTILAYSFGMVSLAAIMVIAGKLLKFDLKYTGMMTLNVIFGSVAYVGVPFISLAYGKQWRLSLRSQSHSV